MAGRYGSWLAESTGRDRDGFDEWHAAPVEITGYPESYFELLVTFKTSLISQVSHKASVITPQQTLWVLEEAPHTF